MRRGIIAIGAALGAALGLAACGGAENEVDAVHADVAEHPSGGSASAAAPVIESLRFRPAEPTSGDRITVQATLAPPRTGSTKLTFDWSAAGKSLPGKGSSVDLPEMRRGDTVRVTVVASNPHGESQPMSLRADVPNQPPRVKRLDVRPDGDAAQRWLLNVDGVDPDGDSLEYTYTWLVNGRQSEVTEPAFPISQLKRGDKLQAQVVASDGMDESDVAMTGELQIENSAPDIVSRPPRLDAEGRFDYQLRANDADGDRALRYELVNGPLGMSLDSSSGRLMWKPSPEQAGRHRVEVAVDDRRGGRSTQEFELAIVVLDDEGTGPAAPR